MNKDIFQRLLLITVLVSSITTMVIASGFNWWANSRSAPTITADFDPFEISVINAVKSANPAVVAITVSVYVPVYEQYFEMIPNPFNNFFNYFIPQYRELGTTQQEIGGGSGFLISDDGYIVTNRHVVEDPSAEYAVFLNDGRNFTAQVVYRDAELDLAVIKIEGRRLPYLPFGDSDKLEIGQSVIAIGNALAEFRNTVSLGIVSGLARSVAAVDQAGRVEKLDELIQTDAAINPGNSGGPLLNLAGEVIGVNVATARGADNISFALSSNMVRTIVESVRTQR
jgi:serine protease Do